MEQIARVPVEPPVPAPGGTTNAYVVGRSNALLIDPPARSDRLNEAVATREVRHVAVTHTHPDHVGAVADYAQERNATVWVREGFEDRFEAMSGAAPTRTFRDGTTIEVEFGNQVQVLDTPGHAPDHVAFAVERPATDRSLTTALAGDLAVAEGSVAVTDGEGDLRQYLDSLARLRDEGFERLLPGHGPPIEEPRETLERLVEHRNRRERRVLAAVRDGARTPDEITDAAYDKELTGVREMAVGTVRAHLDKLDADGEIEWDGSRARMA